MRARQQAAQYSESDPLRFSVSSALVCSFLIFFMQAGFALLEAGAVGSKDIISILLKNFTDLAISSMYTQQESAQAAEQRHTSNALAQRLAADTGGCGCACLLLLLQLLLAGGSRLHVRFYAFYRRVVRR